MGTRKFTQSMLIASAIGGLLLAVACDSGTLFNPAFVTTTSGGYVPLTPGPRADFVLVRCVNDTGQNARFVVAIERESVRLDDDGEPVIDDGVIVTEPTIESVRIQTRAASPANELSTLFPCSTSAINRVGLGENLLSSDTAVFVGGGDVGQPGGVGISAETLSPLSRVPDEGPSNFNCGDTVIFRAIADTRVAGGVRLESFLLPGAEQPSIFTGPNTFVNYQEFLESQAQTSDE